MDRVGTKTVWGNNLINTSRLQRVLPVEAQHRKRRESCLHLNNNTPYLGQCAICSDEVHIHGQVSGERLGGAQHEGQLSHNDSGPANGKSDIVI